MSDPNAHFLSTNFTSRIAIGSYRSAGGSDTLPGMRDGDPDLRWHHSRTRGRAILNERWTVTNLRKSHTAEIKVQNGEFTCTVSGPGMATIVR